MTTDNGSSRASPLAAVPAFDFDSYLLHLTGHRWTIQELSGGNANHTVRAVRQNVRGGPGQDARDHDGTVYELDGHLSIVVKQAPPYFVKFPDMPFSQNRQVSPLVHNIGSASLTFRNALDNRSESPIPLARVFRL